MGTGLGQRLFRGGLGLHWPAALAAIAAAGHRRLLAGWLMAAGVEAVIYCRGRTERRHGTR